MLLNKMNIIKEQREKILPNPAKYIIEHLSTHLNMLICVVGTSILIVGCGSLPKESAEAESQRGARAKAVTSVDVAIARTELLRQQPEYTGTTTAYRVVSVRSQVEGRVLSVNVEVGDRVKTGQVIAQLDDALLVTALKQAEAELASLNSEVARATTQISNARADVERLRLELAQAEVDSQRQQQLLSAGAIAQQAAERSQTAARTATQLLRAATEQVRTEQQAVAAAQGRVLAQQALVTEARERRSYSKLVSPVSGVVTEKITEPGNLLQPGNEAVKIGDFSRIKVVVQVSELELANIRVGQSAEVALDAFTNQKYTGRVTKISPTADATARLIPIEVVIPNTDGKIGSGLLTRVNFQATTQQRVVVPQAAIQLDNTTKGEQKQSRSGTVFVVNSTESNPKVVAKTVTLGEKADSKVEILSGLVAGESYVVRSGKPLKDGETVRMSILSEQPQSTVGKGAGG